MNDNNLILLNLIKYSQFGTNNDTYFSPNIDWKEIYDEAVNQAVLGIVAPEVPDQVALSDDRWKKAQYKQIASYTRYNYSEELLKCVLDKAGIPFVILKGNAAACYYRHPERRMMGDIDFLVSQDLFTFAKDELINAGYLMKDKLDEEINARHIGFSKDGQLYELHHHFSHKEIDFESIIVDGLKNREINNIKEHYYPVLPKLANGIVLLDHMSTHLKSGIGLRQVIDWMMYVYHELDDEFWNNEFAPVLREKGLLKLAIISTRMCQIYLGLPETINWCKDADEKLCKELIELLFISGNFGIKNGKGTSVETVSTNIKRHGLFKWLQYAGEFNWKAYKKHKWLKPFCWIYQIFRYASKGFKSGRNSKQLSDDLNRSNRRFTLLKELDII